MKAALRRFERAWWKLPFWLNAAPFAVLMAMELLGGHGTNLQFLAELREQRDERRQKLGISRR